MIVALVSLKVDWFKFGKGTKFKKKMEMKNCQVHNQPWLVMTMDGHNQPLIFDPKLE